MLYKPFNLLLLLSVIILILQNEWTVVSSLMCDRTPPTATVAKTPGDGGFKITVNGNSHTRSFVPGAVYTVRISGPEDQLLRIEKFSGFLLVAESADGIGHSSRDSAGTFKLKDDSLARFSEFCPDAVKQSSEIAKSEIHVLWTAPSLPAKCVNFRATVIKNSQIWYMDDDQLTKELCSENSDVTDEGDDSGPCTACEEAKYEMTFEGLWSGLTHPKDFPSNEWKPQFKDLIGASHSRNYRIWENEGIASEGLRHIAERDDPKYLETELKDQSSNIRTIIKARGIEHTNVQGLKTYAIFRADKDHNLISFVSRIDPSPDWFVGVSALNLCTRNGSWVTDRTVQLFPWDAGTDNGIRYLDRDMPTMPRHRIRQIVWSNDINSPFYDPDGNMIKPFATLYIQQLRSYRRSSCDQQGGGDSSEYGEDEFEDDDAERSECGMHQWSAYSPCSVNCGQGIKRKYRTYINERAARDFGCNRTETKEIFCYPSQGCTGQHPTSMSHYDSGHNSYGGGASGMTQHGNTQYGSSNTHTLEQYGNPSQIHSNVEQKHGSGSGYGGPPAIHNGDQSSDDPCATTDWTPMSNCQDPCGKGIRYQSRKFRNPAQASIHGCETTVSLRSKARCPMTSECREAPEVVDTTNPQTVSDPDCEVSRWREWTPCSVSCGQGSRTRSRVYRYHGVDHSKCKLEMIVIEPCQGVIPVCEIERTKENCNEPKSEGECRNNYARWYYDTLKLRCLPFSYTGCKGNKNNFETQEECEILCGSSREPPTRTRHSNNRGGVGETSDNGWPSYQQMSPTSNTHFHTNRDPDHTFNNHPQTIQRHQHQPYLNNIPVYTSRSSIITPTPRYSSNYQHGYNNNQHHLWSRQGPRSSPSTDPGPFNDGPFVDCKMSPWSSWSNCSTTCGRGYKYQTRYVKVFNQNGGKSCPTLLERTRSCRGTICPANMKRDNKYFSDMDIYDYQL